MGDFASSAAVGLLSATVSPAGFSYAAAWMALSAAGAVTTTRRHREPAAEG